MYIENLNAQEVQDLFLQENEMILAMDLVPIRGTGKNCLVVEYGFDSCGEIERTHFFVSDFEVRRPTSNELFAQAAVDKIATADLREYLLKNKGAKYETLLDEFESPCASSLIK